MKSFRETFYDLLRDQKATNGTWTKSFTWRQVMDVYDQAASDVGLTVMPGCVAHGFCPGCVQDENEKRLQELELMAQEAREMAIEFRRTVDGFERSEGGDHGPVDSGDPRTS